MELNREKTVSRPALDPLAWPYRIDFYGLGVIERESKKPTNTPQNHELIFGFQLQGEFDESAGYCAIAFDRIPRHIFDGLSMAEEVANILAAKFVSRLSEMEGERIRMSPPLMMFASQQAGEKGTGPQKTLIHRSIENALKDSSRTKTYAFEFEEQACAINVVYLPPLQGRG